MKLSTDRILTTHVGSLPRPQALIDLMVKRDRGAAYDAAEMRRGVRQAVSDLVARQVKIGIDIVSDGEASKIGYSQFRCRQRRDLGADRIDADLRRIEHTPDIESLRSRISPTILSAQLQLE
jgi:hypothetical protein